MSRQNFSRTLLLALVLLLTTTATASAQQSDIPGKIVLRSEDAYIAYDATTSTWEIGTSGIRRRMEYRAGAGFRLTRLTNKLTRREWLSSGSGASAELQLEIGKQILTGTSKDLALIGFRTQTNTDHSIELVVSLAHPTLRAHLHYTAFPNTNVLEQWVEVENTSKGPLPALTMVSSFSVGLRPSADPLTLYWVQGLDPVRPTDTSLAAPVLRLRSVKLEKAIEQVVESRGRSSEGSLGWFALASPNLREGMFGGIEWSGEWRLRAKNDGTTTALSGGLENIHHTIQPGEIFLAPRRFIGFYRGDLDDAANTAQEFVRGFLLRPRPADFPWAQYNTWFAYYTNLDEEILRQEVDAAAELGLDVFVLDAGWYEGSPKRADFSYGLGTWRENHDKFPSGIADFSAYVHSKGLKFGLWVEPGRVDLDAIQLDVDIPRDWLAPITDFDAVPPPDVARTTNICFGNREARKWAKTWLSRLIREYSVDWLKWDDNVWVPCDAPNQIADGNYAHFMGLYEILDYLRAEFPHLIIENCASGGHRMDYALMRRTDLAWLSDETEPSYRVRYHVTGASYAFPADYLNSWLVESYSEHLATGNTEPLPVLAWLRSRMMGAFGVSVKVAGLSPAVKNLITTEVKRYKDYRAIIARGKHYQLLPQNDLAENLEPPEEPDAAEFFDPATGKGVIFLFRGNVAWAERRVMVKGLDPDTRYQITSADGSISVRQTGRQLMASPVRFQYTSDRPAALLFVQALPVDANPRAPMPLP